ncbi:MAG: hypothetical protein WBQ23_13805 [Bacteroidota bacterium]
MLTRTTFLLLLVLTLLLGTASFFLHQSDYPLTYDEGDYWVAINSGMWTNWTDSDDLPLSDFVEMGLGAIKDPDSRARLSDYIRSSGSTMFYRHHHPPLAFYPAIALRPFVHSLPLQWQLRLANLFWLLVWTIALGLIGWRYAEARTPAIILVPASAAWAMAVVGYNMHLPFGLLASLFFFCWYLYEVHGHTGLRRAAQFLLAACFATVEYGMFLLFFILLWGLIAFWKSREKKLFLRSALISAGWVLLFFAILWPAGVFGLKLLKSWAFVMYIALFRLGAEPVAFTGWWELLIGKWNSNPLELLLLILLLFSVLIRWRELLRRGSLFAASGFILALLYLQINPTLVYRWYLFPAFAVGFMLFGSVVGREKREKREEKGEEEAEAGEEELYRRGAQRRAEGFIMKEGDSGYSRTSAVGWTAGPVRPGVFGASWERVRSTSTGRALFAACVGIILFLAAIKLVPEPDYSELKQLHQIIEQVNPTYLTVARGLQPQLRPYLPEARFITYHDVAFPGMSLPDSIPLWRSRGFVLIPKGLPIGKNHPDGEVGGYEYFVKDR